MQLRAACQTEISANAFEHFTTDNGLSNDKISCITQDHYGYIWIATENGLNRFDGYSFTKFVNDKADISTISNNIIKFLFTDRKGYIWAGTNNGLNRFDPRTETFKRYLHKPADPSSIYNNQVVAIYEDEQGYIWAGTHQSLDRLDPNTGIFLHYFPPSTKGNNETNIVFAVTGYDNDIFLSVWGAGAYRFNRQKKTFTPVIINHSRIRPNNWINKFYKDKKGNLLAIDGVLLKYNKSDNQFKLINKDEWPDMHQSNTCITETVSNTYISGSAGGGFYIYQNDFSGEERIMLDNDTTTYLKNSIEVSFTSNTGDIWFGMIENGLFKWNTNQKKFEYAAFTPGIKNSLFKGSVWAVNYSKTGKVWLGSMVDGVAIFNPADKSFTHLKESPGGLNCNFIRTIFEDKQGNHWIGTWGQGLNRIDAKTGKFTYYQKAADIATSLQDNFVTSVCQSADNRLWVATTNGLSVISNVPGKPSIRSFIYEKGSVLSPGGVRVDAVLEDHTGNIWIGTEADGLSRLKVATNTFEYFNTDEKNQNSLGGNRVNALFEDSKNRLWISCAGSGLDLFLPGQNSFVHYTQKDGLPSNELKGITEDGKGRLWLTTDKGLSCFYPEEKVFKNYDREDGLINNHFMARSIGINAVTGKIYGGTKEGLIMFHPDSIKSNPFVPPVYISSFKKYRNIGDETVAEYVRDIKYLDEIELNYNENTFTTTFLSLNFSSSLKNQYMYKLKGLNANWISLGNTRELTFSKLPPGKYELRVKASNSDQVWNETGRSLTIKILPPWWHSWWAYSCYAIIAAALVYVFITYRVKQGIKRSKELEKIRTNISSDLHDDVGSLLSGLAMQSQMLAYSAREEQKQPLQEISTMSRDAMERMRDTVWAMDSRKDKYENLIDRMRDFAEKNLSLKAMTHDFIISDIDTKKFIHPEKRQAVYLIFKEAITNIVKHCDGRHVVIKMAYEKSGLHLSIHDNGPEKKGGNSDGLGMSNMKMRAKKIGGAITTKYDNGFMVELFV